MQKKRVDFLGSAVGGNISGWYLRLFTAIIQMLKQKKKIMQIIFIYLYFAVVVFSICYTFALLTFIIFLLFFFIVSG